MKNIKDVILKILAYCRANDWAGYDPYDALNSKILKHLFVLDTRLPRIAVTQFMKRSPINFRRMLLVPKTQNPKAIGLFLKALVKLSKLGMLKEEYLIGEMVERLEFLRTEDAPYRCWGYSFPWQTRTIIVAKGAPNLVCTVFVANALLDAYEINRDPKCLAMAVEAAEYIIDKLYWTDSESTASFCYPLPSTRIQIHNANFLGAALLCRVYKYTRDRTLLMPALKVARFSASKQRDDGSWYYGESPSQNWIDNFHTGYNLMGLRDISIFGDTKEFYSHIQRGFEFYRKNFFRDDGAAKYFHNKTYPIDIHCVAQSLITLPAFKEYDDHNIQLSFLVFKWAMTHLWDERGYFYYQVHPLYTNKISYMRWSQAWMLMGLSNLLEKLIIENEGSCAKFV